MYRGPRMKTAPFAPFNKAFLPESMLRKFGFVKSNDMPYERSHAVRTTHQEFYKVVQESMFGAPNHKILRVDPLREKIIISDTEKGRGVSFAFSDIKQVVTDDNDTCRVSVIPHDSSYRTMTFGMESPEVALAFTQRLETLVQARKIGDS
ncbi:hypothetical protein TVAG_293860 [Trichomonas vaginalis G3]|uniref:Uncharacterized protein n=1 Tax=Trichomonas vaginalis (strain ATCC PRA-98 / G3) TaxID=412133 RepID=A2FKB6_TRIV3|nr:hypothetical protein TVAGG3_0619730 [Trichomonas vaginalis G3]EAX94656.1 hypothetical protein TVAG_293860 [Trichomonas vaginalis G3]KAI5503809.1 hypothetical protein TVAGG3_0619730 [Trichomonas vaginalis G3]|eukprot:XP_001307586.1 hypothetical protein [Trichomonas vaginalis G3]